MAKKKSNTTYHKFKGQVSYCMPYRPDEFRGASNWKLNLHVDKETHDAIKAAGIQLELKNRDIEGVDNPKHFTFKRPTERKFRDGLTLFTPPWILNEDGSKRVHYENADETPVMQVSEGEEWTRVGDPVLIGNGSLVEIEVEVYETGSMGKGNRLRTIRIIDLIEYVPPEDVEEDEDEDDAPFIKDDLPEKPEKPAPKSKSKKVDW